MKAIFGLPTLPLLTRNSSGPLWQAVAFCAAYTAWTHQHADDASPAVSYFHAICGVEITLFVAQRLWQYCRSSNCHA